MLLCLLLLGMALVFVPGEGNSCSGLGGTKVGKQCLTFHEDVKSWYDAKTACAANDGILASFSDDPQAVLDYTNKYYSHKHFWAGGNEFAGEGNWMWLNGQPFDDKVYWYPGEPTNYPNEACLLVNYVVGEHFWNGYYDDVCTQKRGYICELDQWCSNNNNWCDEWAARGACASNPTYMLAVCPCSCQECYDKNEDCGYWASIGECKVNPGYMLPVCPVSCNECKSPRSKNLPSLKQTHPGPPSPPSNITSMN